MTYKINVVAGSSSIEAEAVTNEDMARLLQRIADDEYLDLRTEAGKISVKVNSIDEIAISKIPKK